MLTWVYNILYPKDSTIAEVNQTSFIFLIIL